MEWKLHTNNWTPIITDIDLKIATEEDIHQISKLVAKHVTVVIKNQFLSVKDLVKTIKMFKDPRPLILDEYETKECCVDPDDSLIYRVTGKKNENGFEGLTGYTDEVTWHSDYAWRSDDQKHILLCLYGVEHTAGSRTSYNNNVLAYNALPDDIKKIVDNLKGTFLTGRTFRNGYTDGRIVTDWDFPIVRENRVGAKGLFFPGFQFHQFVGMSKEDSDQLRDILRKHILQEQFLYHHDWQDGDLVIADQWYSVHKRWAFDKIKDRLLNKCWFGYPDIDYKS